MPMFRVAFLLAFVGGAVGALAQAPAPAPSALAFEVASIKPNATGDTDVSFGARPGGWAMTNAAFAVMIRAAYPAQTTELIGAPEWVLRERYDVNAKASANPTREQLPGMLQLLLAERLKLKAHYVT